MVIETSANNKFDVVEAIIKKLDKEDILCHAEYIHDEDGGVEAISYWKVICVKGIEEKSEHEIMSLVKKLRAIKIVESIYRITVSYDSIEEKSELLSQSSQTSFFPERESRSDDGIGLSSCIGVF